MLLSSGHKRSPRENFLQALQGDYIIWKYQTLKITFYELVNLLNSYGTLNQVPLVQKWFLIRRLFETTCFFQSDFVLNVPLVSECKTQPEDFSKF